MTDEMAQAQQQDGFLYFYGCVVLERGDNPRIDDDTDLLERAFKAGWNWGKQDARAREIAGQLRALDEVPLPTGLPTRAYEDWLQDMKGLRAAVERGELVKEETVSDSKREVN